MKKLGNYVAGHWVTGQGEGTPLFDAVTGEIIANASTEGLDFGAILTYGRRTGSPALRKMSFQERGRMLKKLALHLQKKKEQFYEISYRTGATRADSWIDIEGGFGNLFANASLRRNFPDQHFYLDGEAIDLSRGGSFMAQHIMVPKRGVAIHINAFNFPVWGMLEKCAVNWMAGVAAVVKPATATSFLTEAVVREIITSGILPEGALQLICGSARHILDHVDGQDVVTFTGSAETGCQLKAHPAIIAGSVPFNMEADSLNAAVLGKDAQPGTPEFDLFIREVRKEMTVKCGQKCTAIRRVMVPEALLEDVQLALSKELSKITIGHPAVQNVRMGALASKEQVREIEERISQLCTSAELVYDRRSSLDLIDADPEKGAFISPVLLLEKDPLRNHAAHEIEAFGPVSTLMPYQDLDEAIELVHLGKGSLCCSISTYDNRTAREFVLGAASHHGRILVLNRDNAAQSTGHGSPLPSLVHGGPGRAGGGEEMGGMRGVGHYMQRCAVQASPTTLTAVTGVYQPGSAVTEPQQHPFRYHYEDLEVGMSLLTHKRTITDSDIQNFANLSWDVFYAHTDITSLKGSIFEKRAAHGYFILSAAAGLFVSPAKGPVGANYGLEDCRFLRPVYHNDTIQVRLTCKEKRARDSKGKEHPSGVVKWYVEVFDQDEELVAVATILTLVQKRSPFPEYRRDIIANYLDKLTEQDLPQWGILRPQHMVEHLEWLFLLALQGHEVPLVTPEDRIGILQESLYNYRPFPEFFQHPLLRKDELEPLRHSNLAAAKAALLKAIDDIKAFFKANPEATVPHPVFGQLDHYEWELMNRKHFYHHFRQFGLL